MTAPGMCRTCKHWYTDGERFRSWAGECLHVCSPLHLSQTEADDTCPVWEPLFKRHAYATPDEVFDALLDKIANADHAEKGSGVSFQT